jgi:hypothetical protein
VDSRRDGLKRRSMAQKLNEPKNGGQHRSDVELCEVVVRDLQGSEIVEDAGDRRAARGLRRGRIRLDRHGCTSAIRDEARTKGAHQAD